MGKAPKKLKVPKSIKMAKVAMRKALIIVSFEDGTILMFEIHQTFKLLPKLRQIIANIKLTRYLVFRMLN
jgi:hypothetical protein